MEPLVVKKIDISNAGNGCHVGQYIYFKDIDAIYYKAPYPFPVEIMVSEGLSKVQVTPAFVKMPFILKGWINLDILLREIELIKLVLNGKLLLHASCVNNTLIVGFPNSGKTYKTYSMIKAGGTLISEEYTVIDGLRAMPYKFITRSCFSNRTVKDCGIKLNLWERIKLWINTIRAKLMPFMFEDVIWKELKASGKIHQVLEIVYGSTGSHLTNWKQLAILTENEFPFMANDLLQAYAIATGFDMIEVQEKQRKLIQGFYESIYPLAELQ